MLSHFFSINKILMVVIFSFFLTQTATALTKQDFAYIADISEGKQSLRQFELPYEILQGLQRQDYADLRIFNSQNQSIPFRITVKNPQAQQYYSKHELDFFTLPKNPQHLTRLQIEINKFTHWLSFSTPETSTNKLSYIIIKNQYTDKNLDKLKLHWISTDHAFSLKLKLEQSDDLEHWKTIKNKTTLYNLKHDSTVLIKDTVVLPNKSKAKYFRLSFRHQHDFLHSITKITGIYHHQNQAEHENWKSIPLKQGNTAHEWLFDTESVAPIVKIEFEIPQTGLFYQGTLFSKHKPAFVKQATSKKSKLKKELKKLLHSANKNKSTLQNNWRYQQAFTQYRLITKSEEIKSEALSVPGYKDSYWRILLKQPLRLLPEQVPTIKIAWAPVIITFLAQGNEPYQLLFGNEKINPIRTRFPKTFSENTAETVSVGAVNSIKKPVTSSSPTTIVNWFKQINWQKALLWLILCSSVLFMGRMAYQLYLGMNKK
jgi:hypothetical protein